MLLVIHAVMIAVFVILGIVFRRGKGAFLIAGYNTASKAEKASIDKKTLCRYTGNLMFILAACWGIIASSEMFHRMWLLWLGLGLYLAAAIAGALYISGDRIKR